MFSLASISDNLLVRSISDNLLVRSISDNLLVHSISDSLLVCTVFLSAYPSCYNFIGFNYQFGITVSLVREIRARSLLVVLIYAC